MFKKYLVYNFSGELDDISHLFPNERLGRIASIIKEYGKDVDIIDRANLLDLINFGKEYMENLGGLSFHESNEFYESKVKEEAKNILRNKYDVIFMNLWHGNGFKFSMDLANFLKKLDPKIKIYGVGQKVDWFKEHILRLSNNSLDGLITGLGYNAIEKMVLDEDINNVPNIVLYKDGEIKESKKVPIDVDDYPVALYDRKIYKNIGYKIPVYSITLSNQACPYNCVFCPRRENYGTVNIPRKIEKILKEIENLYFDYNVRHFRIEDSTPPENSLIELSKAILNSKLKGRIKFSGFSRIDTNSPEVFPLLKKAGFVALFFGMESFDDENLKKLKKGITYQQIRNTISKVHEANIYTVGSFIFPIPQETKESMNNTLRRIKEIKPYLDSLLVLPAGVYPHTEWYNHPEKYGIKLDSDYVEKAVIYPLKYLIPFEYWPPFPFKYEIMNKKIEDVSFEYIVNVYKEFLNKVKNEFNIPAIPDYYFLLSDLAEKDYKITTEIIVKCMAERDYLAIEKLFLKTK